VVPAYDQAMEGLDFTAALAAVKKLVARANKYIEETAPWKLRSAEDDRLGTVCAELLEAVRVSTLLLHPFIPRPPLRSRPTWASSWAATGAGPFGVAGAARGDPVGVGEILFPDWIVRRSLGGR